MISVNQVQSNIGDVQRSFLTIFKIEKTPDDTLILNSTGEDPTSLQEKIDLKRQQNTAMQARAQASLDAYQESQAKVTDLKDSQARYNALASQMAAQGLQGPTSTYRSQADNLNSQIADAERDESTARTDYEWDRDQYFQTQQDLQAAIKELEDYALKADGDSALRVKYAKFLDVKNRIDLYSLKTVMPARKSQLNEFRWEGELFYYPGRDDNQKQADVTFVLDEEMLVLPFFYLLKDLTGTASGSYRARRGDVYNGYYYQECDFGVYQIAWDRSIVTGYVRLKGVRVYEISELQVDKGVHGQDIPLLTVKIAWDYTEWDDSVIGMMLTDDVQDAMAANQLVTFPKRPKDNLGWVHGLNRVH